MTDTNNTVVTYNDSANVVLARAQTILTEVQTQLESQKDGEHFNVKKFSEKLQSEHGWDELFTSTLIRTVVNASDEYHSRRGRNGGVAKRTEAELTARLAPSVPAVDESPVTQTSLEVQVDEPAAETASEPASEAVTSESSEALNDQDSTWLEQAANE